MNNVNYPSLQEKGEKIVIKIKISRQLNTRRDCDSIITQSGHNYVIIALKLPLNHTIC